MRPAPTIALLCGLLSLAIVPLAQISTPSSSPEATIRVEQATLSGVQRDRLTFTAKVGLVPEKSINVKSFSFSKMTVNGLPVYISPLEGKFALKQGVYLKLPDVQMVVYERDVASLAPLRDAVTRERVLLSGQVTATLDANVLEEVALRSLHPKIVLPFSKEIPVLIPGGAIGRQAALAALDAVAEITPAAAKLLGGFFPGEDAAWRNDVADNQVRHLLLIHTAYAIAGKTSSIPLEFEQLGFWIGPSTAIVPEEAIAPWDFDPEVQAKLDSLHGHIDKDSIVISVRPIAAAAAFSASSSPQEWLFNRGDFKIAVSGKAAESHESYAPGLTSVKVRQRASSSNYAVLRFRDGIAGNPVQLAGPVENGWDRLAILRTVRVPGERAPQTEVIMLPGTKEGQQIRFAQPVDDSAFGSPVFTQDGAVAMVQDQMSATFLSSIKHLETQNK